MSLDQALAIIPTFVLVAFRIGGMMIFAPLFGSAKVPKRVKTFFTLVLALGVTASVQVRPKIPDSPWDLALGIGGEIMFGLLIGTVISLVCASFRALPLLSIGVDRSMLDLLTQLFEATAILAMRLAAPVLVTMLVVDLCMGVIGKTMPQMNVMSVGLTLRIIVGILVVALGVALTGNVIEQSLRGALSIVEGKWVGG